MYQIGDIIKMADDEDLFEDCEYMCAGQTAVIIDIDDYDGDFYIQLRDENGKDIEYETTWVKENQIKEKISSICKFKIGEKVKINAAEEQLIKLGVRKDRAYKRVDANAVILAYDYDYKNYLENEEISAPYYLQFKDERKGHYPEDVLCKGDFRKIGKQRRIPPSV